MSEKLPFDITARHNGKESAIFIASVDGEEITSERYVLGCGTSRRRIADLWANDERLRNGKTISPGAIANVLEKKECDVRQDIDRQLEDEENEIPEGLVTDQEEPRRSQATMIAEMLENIELFHHDDEPYATIQVFDHYETLHVRQKVFRLWVMREFYNKHGKACGSQALQDALGIITARALFENECIPVYVRIAEHEGKIYVDLCNAKWQVVEIDKDGWSVTDHSPVKFRRSKGMLPLPVPVTGGSVDELRDYINVKDDESFILLVAFIIQALKPDGPFPVLMLNGEQGSAKSTACRFIRSLIDPNIAQLRSSPRGGRDLMITARNSRVITLDNLSNIPTWLSDAICRLSTGGGFAIRELYTDFDETIIDVQRPVIINGITSLAERSDLIDRRIGVELPVIPENKRRPEKQLWAKFEIAQPRIMGALFNAVSMALQNIDEIMLDELPRMADFALWIAAAEPALPWQPGTFLKAYTANRADANELAIESNPVATVILSWFASRQTWSGTASELLKELDKTAGEHLAKTKDWPKKPNHLSNMLKRISPNLRNTGISIENNRTSGKRMIVISKIDVQNDDDDDHDDEKQHCSNEPFLPNDDPGEADKMRIEAVKLIDSDPEEADRLFAEADRL